MAATVLIEELNGAGETATDKTSGTVRYKNADDAVVDTANPLIIPTSNREYSFEKFLRLRFTVAPDTEITNLEAYTDGASWPQAQVKGWYVIEAAYTTPAVPTETNDPPQMPVGGTPVAAVDLFALTSGAPADLGAGPHTGTGQKGSYLVTCMEVEIGATQGTQPTETLTFRFDEI